MGNSKKYIVIITILVIVTGGLLYIDYQNNRGDGSPSFFTNIIRSWFSPRNITTDVLQNTSLANNSISDLSRSEDFFPPYLTLPDNIFSSSYTINGTSIKVYEIDVQNPFQVVRQLTSQQSSRYSFNVINQGTFYLNQIPLSNKTHNFLAIVINNILYGFQYKATEHPQVLEIIDVLQANQ